MFASVEQLAEWLETNQKWILTSRPVRLSRLRILLQSIASGDFNPAHCLRKFAPYSIFGTMVSHGVGVLARAEGEFLQHVQFAEPTEVIALGIEATYRSPLRCGDMYWYEFTITNLRQRKNRWDCDCHIVCMAITPGEKKRVVVEENWKPSFVEPKQEVPREMVECLRVKPYWQNLLQHVALPMALFTGKKMARATLWSMLLIAFCIAAQRSTAMQWEVAVEVCKDQAAICYYGTGPM